LSTSSFRIKRANPEGRESRADSDDPLDLFAALQSWQEKFARLTKSSPRQAEN